MSLGGRKRKEGEFESAFEGQVGLNSKNIEKKQKGQSRHRGLGKLKNFLINAKDHWMNSCQQMVPKISLPDSVRKHVDETKRADIFNILFSNLYLWTFPKCSIFSYDKTRHTQGKTKQLLVPLFPLCITVDLFLTGKLLAKVGDTELSIFHLPIIDAILNPKYPPQLPITWFKYVKTCL